MSLSNVYLNNGQLEQVVDQALAAVALYKAAHSPYWVHAEYNAGIAYVMMGENEAAVPHLIAARDHGMSLSPRLIDIIDSITSAHNDKEPMPISADTPCDWSVMQTVHGPSSHPDYKTLVLQCIDVIASMPTRKTEARRISA